MTRHAAAFLVCPAFVVACGAFGEGAEVAADGGSVPGPDASDATAADAIAADTSTGFACPLNVLWCETFDKGFEEWSGASAPAHTIGSAPDHGNIAVTKAPEGVTGHTFTRGVPSPTKDVRIELSLRIAAPMPDFTTVGSANVAVAGVEVPAVGAIGLFVDKKVGTPDGRAYVAMTASVDGAFNFTPGEVITYGDWHRATIDLRFGTAQSYGFSVGGTRHSQTLPKTVDAIPSSLFLGAWRPNDSTPALVIDFDDIVVTSL